MKGTGCVMKEEDVLLNREIETLRRELNHSIKDRESLSELYDLSVQLDKLIEQYIQREQMVQ